MMNQASGEQASVVMKLMVMVAGIIGLLSSYRCQCSNRNRCVDRWILRKTHGWSLPDIFWGPKNNGMSLSPTTPKRDIQLGTKKWDDYPRVNKHKSWKTMLSRLENHLQVDPSKLGPVSCGILGPWLNK